MWQAKHSQKIFKRHEYEYRRQKQSKENYHRNQIGNSEKIEAGALRMRGARAGPLTLMIRGRAFAPYHRKAPASILSLNTNNKLAALAHVSHSPMAQMFDRLPISLQQYYLYQGSPNQFQISARRVLHFLC